MVSAVPRPPWAGLGAVGRGLHRLGCAVVACLLAACSSLGGARVVAIPQDELARILDTQFPLDSRLMDVVDVQVDAPRLTLLPERNRLATELDVVTSERLYGRAYRGQITLDYGLRYDGPTQAIRLTEVRVNKLELEDGPADAAMPPTLNRLGSLLAEQMLNDLAVYRFTAEEAEALRRTGYAPGRLVVTARGLEITLLPVSN
jgi:hypothetical protein